jgi:hypothetical protein
VSLRGLELHLGHSGFSEVLSHCPPLSNITSTAGFYSQLAGVLAGFAFTALMFLAATRVSSPDRGHAFADAIRILVAAFISLVLTSLNYAIFAGNSASSYGLNASEEPIIGVGFAVSGALVIYAIILTLDAASKLVRSPSIVRPSVGASTRHLLAALIAPLLMYYIFQAVEGDYEAVRYGVCHGAVALDYFGGALVCAQLAVSWFVYPVLLWLGRRASSAAAVSRCAIWVSRLLLAIAFSSAIAFSLIETRPSGPVPPVIPAICMIVMFLAMAGMTWQLAYTAPPRRRNPATSLGPAARQELEYWHIEGSEPRLLRKIRLDYPEFRPHEILQLLSTLGNGSADGLGAERLQGAVLLIAHGDYQKFRYALSLAQRDWRTALELAGLQYDDWMDKLDEQFGPPDQ